jgi:RNA polymerase sigma-70 factor (ECF subfamily)
MRYHNVRNEVELTDEAAAIPDAPQAFQLGGEQQKLAACLDELDGPQRQAIHLAYVNGLSHQEVVNYLSSPLGTIKSWIRRGLQSLQRCLSL